MITVKKNLWARFEPPVTSF